jgi:antitoxin (DNA-binding transcriptional repressor) of toxin-antitoxin stability system
MQTMPIWKFKATCLAVLERVRRTGRRVRVTRFGKPVADMVTCSRARDTQPSPIADGLAARKQKRGARSARPRRRHAVNVAVAWERTTLPFCDSARTTACPGSVTQIFVMMSSP